MELLKATVYCIANILLLPVDLLLWRYGKIYTNKYIYNAHIHARTRARKARQLEISGVNAAYVRMVAGKGRRN